MKRIVLLIAFLWLTVLTAKAELPRSDTKESLRGLNGLYIISQFIDVQPEGLTKNSIENLVKSALAEGGIPMDATPKKLNGEANLSITVSTIKQPQLDVYVFTVEVSVTQGVQLIRQTHSKPMSAETWRKTIQGITSPDRTDVIEQALKQCVNLFVTDYHAVNPPVAH